MKAGLAGIRRIPYERARSSAEVRLYDYASPYIADLENILDMAAIAASGVKIGIDPLGGAAVHYWAPIIERYRPDAVSTAGAAGLTQLMPATARELGVADRFDPVENLRGGADY